jgi:ATP-binding cassette subfamily B protein
MFQLVAPVELLGSAMQQLTQGLVFLERMRFVLDEVPEPVKSDLEPNERSNVPVRLQFEKVSASYQGGRSVLKDVSFTLTAGRTLGVVGASGAGKSTLVRLLVRLIEPDSGRISLDDVSITDMSLSRLRRKIAVVPQDTVLFNDTIGYNIGFGKYGSSQEEIEQAARVAHLHDFVRSLPRGYETRVGERGVKLSGGERQRVSIARAALKQPSIYVFDEATSSLDSQTEEEIVRNLREISKTSTTIVIAHRLSTIVTADEIVVLDGGSVIERGAHVELLRADGRYAALWTAQSRASNIMARV